MNRNPQGHIRQRKEGLWEGQYTFQKHKRSVYGKTELEVRIKLKEVLNSIEKGNYVKPNEHTVSSWMSEWYEVYAKTSLRPSTFINYESIIKRHIIPSLGKMLLKNASVDIVQKFFNSKMTAGRCDNRKGGLSPKTLKNIRHILNVAFSQAFYNRIITYNPIEGIKLPVPDSPEQKVLNEVDKNKLFQLALLSDDPIAKGIIILLNCGLRKGELLGLRWENVNFDDNYIKIKHTLLRVRHFEITSATEDYIRIDTYASPNNKTGVYLGPVKTRKANRMIFLPESVRKSLIDLLNIQRKYEEESKSELFNPYGFVLCTKEGRPLEPKFLEDKFKRFVSKAKLKAINIHATRHTFATEALQKSSDLVTISEILGHATPSTTLDMYGHTFDSRKRELMAAFS